MSFIQIIINTNSETAEKLTDIFIELGALSASIEDQHEGTDLEQAIFNEPVAIGNKENNYYTEANPLLKPWNHSKVIVLFDNLTNINQVINQAIENSGIEFTYTLNNLDDQDWVRLTQSQFNPIKINSKLYIVPSWHQSPDKNATNIILDPGLAFGTGSHPTTFMCLNWMTNNLDSKVTTLLDYGCGSGILAIAAKKIGIKEVFGVDIDPQAIEASTHNTQVNEVAVTLGLPKEVTTKFRHNQFDVVVANILSNPLRFLAPNIASLTKKTVILSGILESQSDELCQIYSQWFKINVVDTMDGWVLLQGIKNG